MNAAARRASGFTMIELRVVILIISVLASLLLPVLLNGSKKKEALFAHETVRAIHAAASMYFEEFGVYPPDTDDFGTGDALEDYSEPESIYRYLGRKIEDKATGKTYGPYLNIKIQYLRDELYCDPWGNPYQLDAIHVHVIKEKGPKEGDVEKKGAPYPPGTPFEKQIVDCKVWSIGPDKKSTNGSSVESGKGTAAEDQDNITSWSE
jgi:prepilin-type N-terminal cleavage/methylation domain-containing protein